MSVEAHIKHRFGAFALDISFRIEQPGITALFGPSGSGKTTTIHALAGLLRPSEGRIVIDGRVMLDTGRGIAVPPRARRVGYVFQDARLFPHMNVLDNLRFGWRRSGRADTASLEQMIDLLGLRNLLARKPARLSAGERSRVAIGRALLADPLLLLLDEPLAALDQGRREEIMPYLERIRDEAKTPMFYVTHAFDELSRLANAVVVLNAGRVTAVGTVFDLLSDLDFACSTGVAGYGAVIRVRVVGQPESEMLTRLAFDGGELLVPRIDRRVGDVLRVRVRAEDILLALDRPAAISANNILAATVTAVHEGSSTAEVQFHVGATRLVARITPSSLARLRIAKDRPVYAIIKSVTIDSAGRPMAEW